MNIFPTESAFRMALCSCGALAMAIAASPAAAQQARPEEIVVTSSIIPQPRRQVGTAMSVVGFDDMELRGYVGLADVLRTQPGIAVSNLGGPGKRTSVHVRGEESFRTLLLIDGVKALDPSAPQVAPTFDSLLTASDLQRVEILRGPQGFVYGADAGGVINVITKTGTGELGGQFGLEYGEDSMRKVDAALLGGGESGDYFVSLVDYETDGFNAMSADTVLQDQDGAENTTLHAKLGWNVAETVRLQLVARDVDTEADYDSCGFPARHDCSGTTDQQIYRASLEHSVDAFSNSFGYGVNDFVRDDFTGGARVFGSEGRIERIEYTGSYAAAEAATFVYGIDFHDERLVADDGAQSRDQKGYYFEYQGQFDDSWFLTVGARYDDNEDFGSHTSSRLSVAYLTDLGSARSLKYRASVGNGFRAPSLFELAYNRGPFAAPPALGFAPTEETSSGYDLGLEYDAANGLHVEVTYFDQQVEDQILFDLVGFTGYLQFPGSSTSEGVEIAGLVPLGGQWQLSANWTYNEATYETDEPRVNRPKNFANLGLLYRAANERLGFIANWRLARDSVDSTGAALDDYAVLDLSANYEVSAAIDVFGRVQNATDESYEEVAGYYAASRSIYGGVRVRF
jgi:vitamin B12 transporter